jgi:hypothetical protein
VIRRSTARGRRRLGRHAVGPSAEHLSHRNGAARQQLRRSEGLVARREQREAEACQRRKLAAEPRDVRHALENRRESGIATCDVRRAATCVSADSRCGAMQSKAQRAAQNALSARHTKCAIRREAPAEVGTSDQRREGIRRHGAQQGLGAADDAAVARTQAREASPPRPAEGLTAAAPWRAVSRMHRLLPAAAASVRTATGSPEGTAAR